MSPALNVIGIVLTSKVFKSEVIISIVVVSLQVRACRLPILPMFEMEDVTRDC
jgi:hypothetical protein